MTYDAIRPALIAALALVAHASAQVPAGAPVDEVRLVGLERVSEQLVRSQLEVQPGQPLNPRAVARDINRLYNLGHFSNIRVDSDLINGRHVVTYRFEEKRFIDEVLILGNQKVRDREVRGVLTWREGDSFAQDAYPEERDAILRLYRSKGFLNATVDIRVEEVSASRVRVTYMIDEGRKARVQSVDFEGNTVLSDRRLRKVVKTRRAWWFFGGRFDEATFENDLRQVVDEYGNHGRLEAQVAGTQFDYSPSGKRLAITIRVAEGPEYTVESLDFANNTVFDDDELDRGIKVRAGDVHNRGQVIDDARAVQEGYQDSGYVNAVVTPQVTLDREKKTTYVVHQVNEGDLKYVREIKITGNSVTKDEVIRRWLFLAPGDRFDGALLRASDNQLQGSQYFESSRITFENVLDNPRFINLLVDVDEGRTGSFNFGAGYSTEQGVGGFASIQLNNFDITNWPRFSGGGQRFEARFSIGDQVTQYSISFTDPEFAGYPFSLGFDFFDERIKTTGASSFTQDTQGAQIRFGKVLSPYVQTTAAFRYNEVDISDFFILNPQLRELRDPGATVSTIWSITRNTQDRFFDPSRGAAHNLSLEVAGFGGDNEFIKLQHDSIWYKPLDPDKKWILSYRTREGIAWTYGGSDLVPLQDRYFAGGATTIRGYDTRDVGPKVRRFIWFGDKEAIGGELRVLNTLEVKYKLTDIVRFYGFMDAGGVWLEPSDFDFGDVKYSIGVGLGFDIPRLGPMRFDYGFPLNPDGDQGSGRLHLQTSVRF